MARIPPGTRDSIPVDQHAAFDAFVQARGSVPSQGPLAIMLNVPELLQRGEHLRAYLRGDGSSLPPNIQELAMILTARELDCQFIWNAHAASARRAGVRDDIVDRLREKKELIRLAPDEAAVVSYGQEFFRTHQVSQATFDAALAQLGVRGLVELTNLMGYYALLAFNINAFRVGLPPEISEAPLP
ncbi:MAG: carboxymuconolactone decarboxylase family protein [Nitrospinae bacterium]|nr:carboxymuconolactone decarboxylase family protein [Nitrospinota bacterium]